MEYIKDSFGLISNIKIASFTLSLKPTEPIALPKYKGSAFRGVLGWRLKKIICVNRDINDCASCMLCTKCLFNYLFSPQLPEGAQFLKHTSKIPSPIIIEPPLTTRRNFTSDDTIDVSLILIGKGIEYLPYLIYVFTEIGKSGIGAGLHPRGDKRRGGRFEVLQVADNIGGEIIYSNADNILSDRCQIIDWQKAVTQTAGADSIVSLDFLTPVRIKETKGEKRRLARLEGFSQIITNLYWRMLQLAYFHCNPWDWEDERFSELAAKASNLRRELSQISCIDITENKTYWQDYDRWSNRQKTKMTLGGFMGKASFFGDIGAYLPLLYLGQYTHLGKQTMFGLGKYLIS